MPQNSSSNIFLFSGTDITAVNSAVAKKVREIAGDDPDPFAMDVVRQREDQSTVEILNQLIYSLSSPSFLGGTKTVWLQNFEGFSAEGTKKSKTPDGKAFHRLCDLLQNGLPADMVLIMNGPDVDKRKQLYKTCEENGEVFIFDKPTVRDRDWQAKMAQIIRQQAQSKGVKIETGAVEYLVEVLGTDTARVDTELEKLIAYCGDADSLITLEAAEEMCVGNGETVPWALLDTFGRQGPDDALGVLDRLLRQEKDPDGAALGYVLQIAGRFRQFLQILVYMYENRLKTPAQLKRSVDGAGQSKAAEAVADGFDILGSHPYRLQKLAEQAMCFSGQDLIEVIHMCCDTNVQLVSSAAAPRVMLEQLVLKIAAMRRQQQPRYSHGH